MRQVADYEQWDWVKADIKVVLVCLLLCRLPLDSMAKPCFVCAAATIEWTLCRTQRPVHFHVLKASGCS